MSVNEARFDVEETERGWRLDRFLAARLAEHSRSRLGRLIREGHVRVDGQTVLRPARPVAWGMSVAVSLPAPPATTISPESIPLRVLHEDAELIVIDKPADLVVHPGHGRQSGTLVHALAGRGTDLASIGAPQRPGIVHRLDRGTSGVIVVAKTDLAHRALSSAFARREIDKRYIALVWGRPQPEHGTIDAAIGRSRRDRLKMTVRAARGREASTAYRAIETLASFTLLDVLPRTGRTHQIRVHLHSLGHPIVGDERYGGRPWRALRDPAKRAGLREFRRLFLHAARLEFVHPASGQTVSYEAPLPEELERLLVLLRAGGP